MCFGNGENGYRSKDCNGAKKKVVFKFFFIYLHIHFNTETTDCTVGFLPCVFRVLVST